MSALFDRCVRQRLLFVLEPGWLTSRLLACTVSKPYDGRELPAARAYVRFTFGEHFDPGPVPRKQLATSPGRPGSRNLWSRVSVSHLFGRQHSNTNPLSTGPAASDPTHEPRRSYQAVITAEPPPPHRLRYSFV